MSIVEKHIVENLDAPVRIYDYLPGKFKTISSRKGIKKAFTRNQIFCNNKVTNSAKFIKNKDVITLKIEEYAPKKPYLKKIDVLYEDDFLAIVNKPPGLVVSGNKWKTLENAAHKNLTPSSQDDALPKALACHRIDAMTGGAVLIAKTYAVRRALGELFEKYLVEKSYLALVHGKLEKSGKFTSPINGKSSQTIYEHISHKSLDNHFVSVVKCQPKTGRRHQIRIHLAENGNPIVGDKKYGASTLELDKKAMFLFSMEIGFKHPITGAEIKVKANPPKKFKWFI